MRKTHLIIALLALVLTGSAISWIVVSFSIDPSGSHPTEYSVEIQAPAAGAAREDMAVSLAPYRDTPVVNDPLLNDLADSTLCVSKRISSDIAVKVPSISDENDCCVLSRVLADPNDNDTIRNEVANLLRRSKYPGLTDALLAVLDNPAEKPRFRSFAVQHLWQQVDGAEKEDRNRIRAKMHELIADRHVEVRREALLALVRMRESVGQSTAAGWLTAKEPSAESTRDLAIRCVYDLGLRDQIPVIRSYAYDPSEVTRIAAIVALSQWGDEDSREAFTDAADSSSIRLQRAGKAALERLDQQSRQPPMASTEEAPKELPDEGAK